MQAFLQPGFWIFVLLMAGIYCIFALGLQVQYGLGGILNFGHVAMMALSSYTYISPVLQGWWSLGSAALS